MITNSQVLASPNNGGAAEPPSFRRSLRLLVGLNDPLSVLGLGTLLKGHHKIIAHAYSGTKLLQMTSSLAIDALLIDSDLAEMSGVNILRTLRAGGCELPVVLIDRSNDAVTLMEALRSGASAIIFYQNVEACLLTCLDHASLGRQWVDPVALPALITQFSRGNGRAKHTLTIRELEIACLVADGHTNKIIARRLGISEGTVKSLLHSVFGKIESRNRTGLVRYVKEHRLI